MKLSPFIHAGALKKALALAGVGGVVFQTLPNPQPELDHKGSDATELSTQPESQVARIVDGLTSSAHNIATVARSVQSAWRHRDQLLSNPTTSQAADNDSSTLAHYGDKARTALASVLAELAIESDSSSPEAASLRRLLADSWIVRRMLSAAANAPPESDLFYNTAVFVAAALRHPDSAVALLSHSGAPSHVMDIAAGSPQVHSAALEALNHLGNTSTSSTSSTASTFRNSIACVVNMNNCSSAIPIPSANDLAHAALAAGKLKQSEARRLLSLRFLRVWSQTGPTTCRRMAELGLGSRLGDVAGSCVSSGESAARIEISQLMANLAEETPSSSIRILRMESWLYPLICFAADAAGEGEWSLARESLAGFSACLRREVELPSRLMTRSVLPLLTRMAEDIEKVPLGERAPLRAAVASTVQALAEGSGVHFSQDVRMQWGEVLLGWITERLPKGSSSSASTCDGEVAKRRVACPACVDALAALGQPPGVAGLQVAHAWLAEMITYLSREVEKAQAEAALDATRKKANKLRPAMRAEPRAAPATSSYFYWVWPSYWKGGSTSSTTASGTTTSGGTGGDSKGVSPLLSSSSNNNNDAAAAFTAHAAAQLQAQVAEEAEEPSTAEKAVTEEAAAVLGPAASASLSDVRGDTAGGGTSSSTWTWWLPTWAGGSSTNSSTNGSPDDDSEADNERDASSRTRSDSELALYINAAPVGPAYARAVAMELLEASGRVGIYTEPPAYAEDALSPAAIAAYSAVAAAVDVEVADRALTQALKALSAMALGDEARREWLVGAGILKLLRRLTMERGGDEIEAIYTAAAQAAARLTADEGQLFDKKKGVKGGGKKEKDKLITTKGDSSTKSGTSTGTAVDGTASATMQAAAAVAQWEAAYGVDTAIPLFPLRQAIRIVALLSVDLPGAAAVASEPGWLPWLQRLTTSDDCKVASCAAKALLNVESAAALVGDGDSSAYSLDLSSIAALTAAAHAATLPEDEHRRGQGTHNQLSLEAVLAAMHRLRRQLDPMILLNKIEGKNLSFLSPDQRLILHDGIHLFDPLAPHHEVLAKNGTATTSPDAPILDLVFVHGIRGGAFATWRREGVLEHGAARESLDREACWPAAWLVTALGPQVRLISAEYAAPASGWEGESLPFPHIAEQVAAKLTAAGVGNRPIVFITHSMGGLVIKEILARGKDPRGTEAQKRLSNAAAGVVFYSVPHAGSRLADLGWSLRYVGASPAKHVVQLTTGPHLEALNRAVRGLARSGLPVLSFSEGLPTQLSYVKTHIVPHESAYPGYGDFVVLGDHDHVSVCKPRDKQDPAFGVLVKFLKERVAAIENGAEVPGTAAAAAGGQKN